MHIEATKLFEQSKRIILSFFCNRPNCTNDYFARGITAPIKDEMSDVTKDFKEIHPLDIFNKKCIRKQK